jgi:hypothetical protein
MPRSALYPEPPHLTIAVYPEAPESECFAVACGIVEQADCEPSGTVETAPWDMEFELRSDLAGRSSILDLPDDQFRSVVAGNDRSRRPVRAGYRGGPGAVVLVEYLAAPRNDRHPIAVSISAEALGIPTEMWGKQERTSASKSSRWALRILQEISMRTPVAYGAIGIEYSLATPSELASGDSGLPSEVFVSKELASIAPGITDALERDFQGGVVVEWPIGWFYSGWAPFNTENVSIQPSKSRSRSAARTLGYALLSR